VQLNLQHGMPRAQVEQMVAALRGEASSYNLYRGGLHGGSVPYRMGGCTLTVEYTPGALPPWVKGPGGVAQHLAPIDEAVKEFAVEIERTPPAK
jgi:hypothetical protein